MAREIAVSRKWPVKSRIAPVGASDASAFSLAGIPSVCLMCMDISRLVPHYHTRFDTIENVRPESLAVSLQLVLDMLEKIDGFRTDRRGSTLPE